jgi:Uma2 family endonuclease
MNDTPRDLLALLHNPQALDAEMRQRLVNALLFPDSPHKVTYQEFLDWVGEDSMAEWVDGEISVSTPASKQHQMICGFLNALIQPFLQVHNLGELILPPFQMKLQTSGREPDLLFVARQNLSRLKDNYLDGPADLVVEITSPESLGRDRGEKFSEYEQAGIPEYWLIDPLRHRAEFYQLDEQGLYRLVPPDESVIYHSQVLSGFWLPVTWLWQPPPILEALKQLGLI